MLRRAYDRFWGLSLAQKALALLFAALFLFSVSYLVATAALYLGYGGRADSPLEEGAAPTASPRNSASASAEATTPNYGLGVSSARWEGEKAVVEGTWRGEVSSVHCDLLAGGTSGKPTRWWDRSVAARMGWSDRTFAQEFVAAEGGEEPLDPGGSHGVMCSAQFSGGWQLNDGAPVEGTPPG